MGEQERLTDAERTLLPHRSEPFPVKKLAWTRVRCRLEAARRARGLTQNALAEASGLGLATIRRHEAKSVKNPSLRVLVACALVLDVPLTALIDADDCEWHGAGAPGHWDDHDTETWMPPLLPPA